jgi:hypothetical protein
MRNVLASAIHRNHGDLRNAFGAESDEAANYMFPKHWLDDRKQRARIIGERASNGSVPNRFAIDWAGMSASIMRD